MSSRSTADGSTMIHENLLNASVACLVFLYNETLRNLTFTALLFTPLSARFSIITDKLTPSFFFFFVKGKPLQFCNFPLAWLWPLQAFPFATVIARLYWTMVTLPILCQQEARALLWKAFWKSRLTLFTAMHFCCFPQVSLPVIVVVIFWFLLWCTLKLIHPLCYQQTDGTTWRATPRLDKTFVEERKLERRLMHFLIHIPLFIALLHSYSSLNKWNRLRPVSTDSPSFPAGPEEGGEAHYPVGSSNRKWKGCLFLKTLPPIYLPSAVICA